MNQSEIPNSTIAEEELEKMERKIYMFKRAETLSKTQVGDLRRLERHALDAFKVAEHLAPELRKRIGKLVVDIQPVVVKYRRD